MHGREGDRWKTSFHISEATEKEHAMKISTAAALTGRRSPTVVLRLLGGHGAITVSCHITHNIRRCFLSVAGFFVSVS
jgi:hypothetical protein